MVRQGIIDKSIRDIYSEPVKKIHVIKTVVKGIYITLSLDLLFVIDYGIENITMWTYLIG